MEKKKIIILSVTLIAILITIIFIIITTNKKDENNNINQNTNQEENIIKIDIESNKKQVPEKLLKERKIGEFKIKDIDILIVNNTTTFKATIENMGNKTYENKKINMIFKTEEKVELGRVELPITYMGPNDTSKIDICLMFDASTATDIILEEK